LLAVATALATAGTVPKGDIAAHVAITLVYFAFGLLPAPKLIHASAKASWNILAKASPIAYTMLVLLAYTAVAAMLNVNIAFAAFLAGLGIVARNAIPAEVFRPVSDFSFAVFIPIYFALVGYRLDLSGSFSFAMLAIFLVASSGVKILSAWTGARMAGFHNQEALNLAVALNARGGPGIVLASVALGAGIINAAFHTTLVLTAVLTSQAAGVWLGQLVRTGGPLLSPGRSGSTVLAPGSA
jgi:Kef-type K+ transport system membrane component KefB